MQILLDARSIIVIYFLMLLIFFSSIVRLCGVFVHHEKKVNGEGEGRKGDFGMG